MKKFFYIFVVALITLPFSAEVQEVPHFRTGVTAYSEQRTFRDMVQLAIDIINPLLVVIVGLSILVFFRGLVAFIAKSGDAKSHAEGKSLMIWGLIALFVMVSVFGILRFFYDDLGFNNPNNPGGLLPLLPD